MSKLPYAIMCELRALAGNYPSTSLVRIGTKRLSVEFLRTRRAHLKPVSAIPALSDIGTSIESKYERSASFQDLIYFGLVEHGYWYDGGETYYGFHLTDGAIEILTSVTMPPQRDYWREDALRLMTERAK